MPNDREKHIIPFQELSDDHQTLLDDLRKLVVKRDRFRKKNKVVLNEYDEQTKAIEETEEKLKAAFRPLAKGEETTEVRWGDVTDGENIVTITIMGKAPIPVYSYPQVRAELPRSLVSTIAVIDHKAVEEAIKRGAVTEETMRKFVLTTKPQTTAVKIVWEE